MGWCIFLSFAEVELCLAPRGKLEHRARILVLGLTSGFGDIRLWGSPELSCEFVILFLESYVYVVTQWPEKQYLKPDVVKISYVMSCVVPGSSVR
ncbi:uncharacterized protein J3R85_003227 [Psidium guajava]|nr:uncharacterized protein J3R85_003227 [Psidium guajava]